MKKIILVSDCNLFIPFLDPDDTLALDYLFTREGVEISGIISSYGNVPELLAYKSIKTMLQKYGLHPPLIHGPKSKNDILNSKNAASFLVKKLKKSKNGITVLSLGPLTIFKHVINMDPKIMESAKDFFVMGGRDFGEFNFRCDKEAARVVLGKTKVKLITYEATLKTLFYRKDIEKFPKWMRFQLTIWYIINRLFGQKGFYPHDLTAAKKAIQE